MPESLGSDRCPWRPRDTRLTSLAAASLTERVSLLGTLSLREGTVKSTPGTTRRTPGEGKMEA
jgi:hypothetical protein